MTAPTGSNAYQRGTELAETGQYEAALDCIQEHLGVRPHDAQALNDAGAILHCLGRSREAIECLTKALALQPDSGEIVWNLVEAYLAANLAIEVVPLVDKMEEMGILNVGVINRLASKLLDQGRTGDAADILLKSQDLWPEQEVLTPIMDIIRSKRPKVAFLRCGSSDDGLLAEALAFVQRRFRTEFLDARQIGEDIRSTQGSDITWFDGGGEVVVEACQLPHRGKVVVSLRHGDMAAEWVKRVRWENVDILIQIGSPRVEQTLRQWVPDIRNRTRLAVIPNGVNADRYHFRSRPKGKHLACIGGLSEEASPGFLLQCMQKLHYIDADFRLFFSGPFQNPVLEQYVRHMVQTLGLVDVVSFEPYPSDLNAWLADKHFVVSSGMDETQVEMLLAGMAAGVKPIVHNFPCAEEVFLPDHLFNIAEEFCRRVLEDAYDPAAYRRFVESRYPIRTQRQLVNGVLRQLESELELQTPEDAAKDACDAGSSVPIRAFGESRPARTMAANA